jgi:hypothetical protein
MKNIARFGVSAVVVVAAICIGQGSVSATQPSANNKCVNKATGVSRNLRKSEKQTCEKNEVKFATINSGRSNTNKSGAIRQQSICGADGTSLCKIGVKGPGGGLIFFVDYYDQYAGFDYFEAAPLSCGSSMNWSSTDFMGTASSGWDVKAVGRGQVNTEAILAADMYESASNSAAKFADSSTCGSQADWFLGSIGEMKLAYTNLGQAGIGGFSSDYYWSSSEYSDQYAWTQGFDFGFQDANYKGIMAYVRPVRSF